MDILSEILSGTTIEELNKSKGVQIAIYKVENIKKLTNKIIEIDAIITKLYKSIDDTQLELDRLEKIKGLKYLMHRADILKERKKFLEIISKERSLIIEQETIREILVEQIKREQKEISMLEQELAKYGLTLKDVETEYFRLVLEIEKAKRTPQPVLRNHEEAESEQAKITTVSAKNQTRRSQVDKFNARMKKFHELNEKKGAQPGE